MSKEDGKLAIAGFIMDSVSTIITFSHVPLNVPWGLYAYLGKIVAAGTLGAWSAFLIAPWADGILRSAIAKRRDRIKLETSIQKKRMDISDYLGAALSDPSIRDVLKKLRRHPEQLLSASTAVLCDLGIIKRLGQVKGYAAPGTAVYRITDLARPVVDEALDILKQLEDPERPKSG